MACLKQTCAGKCWRCGMPNRVKIAAISHVDFEAGERLWVGNPPRADSHRTAEPTVGGFAGFCEMLQSVGQNEEPWVDFWVTHRAKRQTALF